MDAVIGTTSTQCMFYLYAANVGKVFVSDHCPLSNLIIPACKGKGPLSLTDLHLPMMLHFLHGSCARSGPLLHCFPSLPICISMTAREITQYSTNAAMNVTAHGDSSQWLINRHYTECPKHIVVCVTINLKISSSDSQQHSK